MKEGSYTKKDYQGREDKLLEFKEWRWENKRKWNSKSPKQKRYHMVNFGFFHLLVKFKKQKQINNFTI